MILNGRRILVTGVLTPASLAFAAAARAQREGATVVLSSFGRARSLTERAARRLPNPDVEIVELDVASQADLDALADRVDGPLHGVVHAIGFAPESCLGGRFLTAPWDDVATTLRVSAYSLQSLAVACRPVLAGGASIVALDFDNSRHAWPHYDWMGVAKATLAAVARYLARDLGPDRTRVNLVAAGPLRTVAARAIPSFDEFETAWAERAPLGWDTTDPEPVAAAVCALLSDLFPATTGEVVHVDGGYHAIGA